MRVSFSPYQFRQRVRLQAPYRSPPSRGESSIIWLDRSTITAEVVALSGRELINAQQTKAEVTHRIRCRWFSGGATGPPQAGWRGLWNGSVLNFEFVQDLDSARRCWEILATLTVGEVA